MAGRQIPDERVAEARRAIEDSLQRREDTGKSDVEQSFDAAAADGNPIAGDPATTRMDQIPRQYQHSLPSLSLDELISWGTPLPSIVKQLQNGLLGEEYMRWSETSLREYVVMRQRQVERKALTDAGKYASKTMVDLRMEPYWLGQGPHPKTGKYCTFISHIAQLTCPVGINGRIWFIERGKRYDLPTEVIRILVEKSAALDEFEKVASIYQTMGQVGVLDKVAQQGGMTQAAHWAPEYLAPIGGPAMALPDRRIPGVI